MGRGCKPGVHAGNMDIKGNSGDISDGNEEHVIRNWREGDLGYKVTKNLTEQCSRVLRKVEFVNDETGYLAEMSEQSVEGVSWFLLTEEEGRERGTEEEIVE